jgi:3-hydroxyisobutyrate dehydrogenase
VATIGFIGLGNMGGHMAHNLLEAGHGVRAFDRVQALVDAAAGRGATVAGSVAEAAAGVDAVVTMLPAGGDVREVYTASGGVLEAAAPGTLLIDSSTIDVQCARDVSAAAADKGLDMLDAPVSGGVGGAEAGTLTFMVGGRDDAVERARPLFEAMGRNVVHAGGPGNGQAAKICNNMLMGISMIGACEAFDLAARLGLEAQTLFDVVSTSSGQCWAVTSYCPVPGPVPTSPANRDYAPGFTVAMMLKDLKLAQQAAAESVSANTPLGRDAAALYQALADAGRDQLDCSSMFRLIARAL